MATESGLTVWESEVMQGTDIYNISGLSIHKYLGEIKKIHYNQELRSQGVKITLMFMPLSHFFFHVSQLKHVLLWVFCSFPNFLAEFKLVFKRVLKQRETFFLCTANFQLLESIKSCYGFGYLLW